MAKIIYKYFKPEESGFHRDEPEGFFTTAHIKAIKPSDSSDIYDFSFSVPDLKWFFSHKNPNLDFYMENSWLRRKDKSKYPTYEDFKKRVLEISEQSESVEEVGDFFEYFQNTIYHEFVRKQMDAKFGVIQFYRTIDNILLWSHYSADHKGFAIGFDLEHKSFDIIRETKSCRFYDVEYSDEISPMPMNESSIEDIKKKIKFFYTKSKKWEYEKETRFIFPKEYFEKEGKILVPFPTVAIDSIVLGAKIPPILEQIIKKFVSPYPIKIYKANLLEDDYKIEITACEKAD